MTDWDDSMYGPPPESYEQVFARVRAAAIAHSGESPEDWDRRQRQRLEVHQRSGAERSHPRRDHHARSVAERNSTRSPYTLATYDLTEERFQAMKVEQGNRCGICECNFETHLIHIDHDHATSEVRGLLCQRCNNVLGVFESMGIGWIARAIGYLEFGPLKYGDEPLEGKGA